jgi:hypothetical protein
MDLVQTIRRATVIGILACLACSLGCDRKKNDAPAERVAPPVEAPRIPGPTTPASTATAPAKPAITKTVPSGVVVDGWIAGGKCNLEYINGTIAQAAPIPVKVGTPLKIVGWGYDGAGKKLADAVHVRFASTAGGSYYGTAGTGIPRDDVKKTQNLDAKSVASGFELNADLGELAPGEYSLTLLLRSGEKTYICDNGRKLQVVP